jgi:hypothetical protein
MHLSLFSRTFVIQSPEFWDYCVDDHATDVAAIMATIQTIKRNEGLNQRQADGCTERKADDNSNGTPEKASSESSATPNSNVSDAPNFIDAAVSGPAFSVSLSDDSEATDDEGFFTPCEGDYSSDVSDAASVDQECAPSVTAHRSCRGARHVPFSDTTDSFSSRKNADRDWFTVAAVGHSMGCSALLIYVLQCRAAGELHGLDRLVLLSPAGLVFHTSIFSIAHMSLFLTHMNASALCAGYHRFIHTKLRWFINSVALIFHSMIFLHCYRHIPVLKTHEFNGYLDTNQTTILRRCEAHWQLSSSSCFPEFTFSCES